jgi:hypothetical protein
MSISTALIGSSSNALAAVLGGDLEPAFDGARESSSR